MSKYTTKKAKKSSRIRMVNRSRYFKSSSGTGYLKDTNKYNTDGSLAEWYLDKLEQEKAIATKVAEMMAAKEEAKKKEENNAG